MHPISLALGLSQLASVGLASNVVAVLSQPLHCQYLQHRLELDPVTSDLVAPLALTSLSERYIS